MQCVWNPIQEGREACNRQKLNNLRWWFIRGRNSGRWKLLHSSASSLCFVVAVVGSSEHTKGSVLLAGAGDGISVRWWRHGCLISFLELMLRIAREEDDDERSYHRLSPKVNQSWSNSFYFVFIYVLPRLISTLSSCVFFSWIFESYIYIYVPFSFLFLSFLLFSFHNVSTCWLWPFSIRYISRSSSLDRLLSFNNFQCNLRSER